MTGFWSIWWAKTAPEGYIELFVFSLQVIGTLPLLVNPASLTGGAATPTLPLHGLQVQTVTPQLLLNTQGQIIATVGNGPAAVATSAAVLPKAAAPPTLTKPNTQVLSGNLFFWGQKTLINSYITLLLFHFLEWQVINSPWYLYVIHFWHVCVIAGQM